MQFMRSSSELIQSLRITLQKLEESFASSEDESDMGELKRIILLRIADIEALQALEAASSTEALAIEARPSQWQPSHQNHL